jgi:two-component system sensor histidine kinase KdpD
MGPARARHSPFRAGRCVDRFDISLSAAAALVVGAAAAPCNADGVHPELHAPPATHDAGNERVRRRDPLRLHTHDQPRHRYLLALLAIAVATGISFALFPLIDLTNLVMVYLLAVVVVAARLGRGPSTVTTIGGVATFVYFFVPHYYSFVLEDIRYLPTFTILLLVGTLVASLTSRLRAEVLATEERERRTGALYELSRDLAAAEHREALVAVVRAHVARAFEGDSALLVADGDQWRLLDGPGETIRDAEAAEPLAVAMRERREVRTGSHVHLPLIVAQDVVGVLRLAITSPSRLHTRGDQKLLAAFVQNIGLALHRLVVGELAQQAQHRSDQERLRNVMLSSVSHDLRTPLATITGSITTLLDSGDRLDQPTRRGLMESIRDDAAALAHQVRDMLDLTRLESGTLQARREWHPVDEVVGGAMTRVERMLGDRPVAVDVADDLPLVSIDAALVELLLVNLLENAVHHTPPGTAIAFAAQLVDDRLVLTVADSGPGVPAAERDRVFEKFWRGSSGTTSRSSRGSGLGLAICRAIVDLHGGTITVRDRDDGPGACFVATLPTRVLSPRPQSEAPAPLPEP